MSDQPTHSSQPDPLALDGLGAEAPDEDEELGSRGEAWQRLSRIGAPRLTKANALVTVLALALGFALATQVQQTQAAGLEALSQPDLLQVLDDVSQRSARLDAQLGELQRNRDALRSGVDTAAAALQQAQDQVDRLGILAGTVGATGPGISVVISDPQARVTSVYLLDIIQELRDAGAEVIQVGQVRVVAETAFDDEGADLVADGTVLNRPITILAIGEAATMSAAMSIPGGVVDTVRQRGGVAVVTIRDRVDIDALHTLVPPRHATPVPQPAPSTTG
jgi:uncharacterized protein YlxW (UPF0749 family)